MIRYMFLNNFVMEVFLSVFENYIIWNIFKYFLCIYLIFFFVYLFFLVGEWCEVRIGIEESYYVGMRDYVYFVIVDRI